MRLNSSLVLAGIALLAGCSQVSSSQPMSVNAIPVPCSEPAIEITPPDAHGVFHFAFCNFSKEQPVVSRIVLLPPGQEIGDSQSERLCVWKKGSGASLTSEWQYGSATKGSEIVGTCAPLRRGESYEVLRTAAARARYNSRSPPRAMRKSRDPVALNSLNSGKRVVSHRSMRSSPSRRAARPLCPRPSAAGLGAASGLEGHGRAEARRAEHVRPQRDDTRGSNQGIFEKCSTLIRWFALSDS